MAVSGGFVGMGVIIPQHALCLMEMDQSRADALYSTRGWCAHRVFGVCGAAQRAQPGWSTGAAPVAKVIRQGPWRARVCAGGTRLTTWRTSELE